MDKNYLNELVEEFSRLPGIEEQTRNHNWAKKITTKTPDIDLRDPDMFTKLIKKGLDEKAKALFFQAWFTKMPTDVFFALRFVYLHYSFLLNNVSEMITLLDEYDNSKEKAKWLINLRVKQIYTGKIPDIEKDWYDEAQIELWLSFIVALSDLYYGFPEKYIKSRAHLLLAYNT